MPATPTPQSGRTVPSPRGQNGQRHEIDPKRFRKPGGYRQAGPRGPPARSSRRSPERCPPRGRPVPETCRNEAGPPTARHPEPSAGHLRSVDEPRSPFLTGGQQSTSARPEWRDTTPVVNGARSYGSRQRDQSARTEPTPQSGASPAPQPQPAASPRHAAPSATESYYSSTVICATIPWKACGPFSFSIKQTSA